MKRKNETKYLAAIVGLLIVVSIVLVFLPDADTSGHAVKVKNVEPVKIGLAIPLSGDVASFGEGMLTGVELAVKEINSAGGIDGRRVRVVVEDTACDETKGANALMKLVTVDDVDGIIGPLCSGAAGAGLPLLVDHDVPTVLVASAPHLTSLGDNVFRVYPSDTFEGSAAAELMIDSDVESVGVLYVQNDWGAGIADVFEGSYAGEVESIGVFDAQRDFRTELLKLRDNDALYVVAYPDQSVALAKQAKELGYGGLIVGTAAGFETESSLSDPASEGVMYPASRMSNSEEFASRVELVGKKSEFFTPLAYDAMNVLADALECDDAKACLRTTAHKGEAFELISFDAVGDLQSADFDVKQIVEGEAVVV